MVDASLLFLKNTSEIRGIIQQWLDLCLTPFFLSDARLTLDQHKEFKEHRHDQSLLSSVVRNQKLKIQPICHQTDCIFTCHHRSRELKSLRKLLEHVNLKQIVDLI